MLPYNRALYDYSGVNLLQSTDCMVNQASILKAIKRVIDSYKILNVRECFESYCYTDEKCAVCEEAYEDLLDGVDGKIDLGYKNVTFCCKRCLLNGWIDILHYLRSNNVYVCLYPCCQLQVSPAYTFHSTFEDMHLSTYIKTELQGPCKICSDPICNRLGYDQTEALLFDESSLNRSILSDFLKPKMYCSRKHAVATKLTKSAEDVSIKPAPMTLAITVNCDSLLSNTSNELHHTYPYTPVYMDDKWFHTTFHYIVYLMFCKTNGDLAEEVRKTMSLAKVRSLAINNPIDADAEGAFLLELESRFRELMISKFATTNRMRSIAIYMHKTDLVYRSCLTSLSQLSEFNSLTQREISELCQDFCRLMFE